MPAIKPVIAPFSSAFVGNYGDSVVMTRLASLRTGGALIREEFPTSPALRALDYNVVQSGNWTVRITLTFLKDSSDLLVRLCRGLTISADLNSPPGTNQYTLLLISPNPDQKDSYFFPRVRTEKVREVNYSKSNATALQITFIAEDRNPNNAIIYANTSAGLVSTMGSISPI